MNKTLKALAEVAVIAFFVVVLSSCSDNSKQDIANINEPAKIEQDQENHSTNDNQVEVDETVKESVQETNPATMSEFQDLVESKTPITELKKFIDLQIGRVNVKDFTQMVLTFEDLQEDYMWELESRFYEGDQFQEQLMELDQDHNGLDFSNVDYIANPELKSLLLDARDGGYKVETAEGAYFPIIDYEQYAKYESHVNEDIQDYILIKMIESSVISVKDAGMLIGWEELINRALRQEQFMYKHQSSERINDIKRLFGGYVFLTFNGIDNTPLFDYETESFVDDASAAYTKAIQGGTENSPYLQKLSEFLDVLEKNGNKQTEEVIQFQQETTELWHFTED